MKQALIGIGVMLTAVLVVSIMMGIGKDSRMKILVNDAVSVATYQTLKEVMEDKVDSQSCFRRNIAVILKDQTYRIDKFAVDAEKGAISAVVTVQYDNFWYTREVTAKRTVIVE